MSHRPASGGPLGVPEGPLPAGSALSSPVIDLPQIHALALPTPWPVGPVQVYLIESEPLTLVDTGVRSRDSWDALVGGLEALGYAPGDLRRVILTHYHADHLGQAESLRRSGATLEVLCHEQEVELVEGFSVERDENIEDTLALFREHGVPEDVLAAQRRRLLSFLEDDPLCEPTRVDRAVRDGERVAFKDLELEVLHAPGHTRGHLLLHHAGAGVLVTGDHVMGEMVPATTTCYTGPLPEPGDPLRRRPRFRGLPAYLRSLRRLRGSALRVLLPAHGGLIAHPARALDDALLFYEVRIQRAWRALLRRARSGAPVTAWELFLELFPRVDPVTQGRNRLLMVIGILDVLAEEGRLEALRDGARLVHRPVADRPEQTPSPR